MKKYLMAGIVTCLLSAPAQSADITSSFYIPEKTVMSDTLFTTGRTITTRPAAKTKAYARTAKEELTYGFNNEAAVRVSFAETWKRTALNPNHTNSETYGVGGLWKPINDRFKLLTGFDFTNDLDTKSYAGMVQFGYDATSAVTLIGRLFYTETRKFDLNTHTPAAQLGVYAKSGRASTFVGVKYDSEKANLGCETRSSTLAFNADYKLTEKMAVGLRTTYLLHREIRKAGTVFNNIENYTAGVNLKYVF